MQLNLEYSIEDSFIQQISHTFSAVSLPHLNELRLNCATGFGRKCTAICRDWDMLSLRRLEATNVIPEIPSEAASSVRSCRVEIEEGNGRNADWRWRAIEMIDFLMQLTSLEHLDVTFPLRQDDRPYETITLDTVTGLVLRLPKVDSALRRNFLHIAEVPNITSLSLEIGLSSMKQFGNALDKHRRRVRTLGADLSDRFDNNISRRGCRFENPFHETSSMVFTVPKPEAHHSQQSAAESARALLICQQHRFPTNEQS